MATIKLNKFLGEAPKLAAELLPDGVAQYAMNVKVYSGNLIPFPEPTLAETVTMATTIETIYPLRDPVTNDRVWMQWSADVDVATSLLADDSSQRLYFTGDGAPKQTDYAAATTGVGDYPIADRPLGLPAPTAAPTSTVSANTALAVTARARASNIATLTAGSTPQFGVGTVITVATVGGTGYNLTNVAVTAIVGNLVSYNSPGADEATVVAAAGTIAFAGAALLRNYVYTWYTDWAEESQPSPASTDVSASDGQTVTIATLPTVAPTGYTGVVVSKRVYRAVSSASGSFYAFVGEVTLATATLVDSKTDFALGAVLTTEDFDIPDATMTGIVGMSNGMLAGFFGNQLCFSEPYAPWAWPLKYRRTINSDIVGLASLSTSLVVMTKKSPSLATGVHPSVVSINPIDINYPCVSKRSIVNVGTGITYACPDGLAYISTGGHDLITKLVHYRDTWRAQVQPETITAKYYNGKYFASHATGGFIFEQEEKIGGIYTQVNFMFTAAYYDFEDGFLYYLDTITPLQVKRWDDPSGASGLFDWRSKIYRLPKPTNFGAARVLADYVVGGAGEAAANNAIIAANLAIGDTDGAELGGNDISEYAIGDGALSDLIEVGSTVTFQIYIDDVLKFQKQVATNTIFRLPMGYKSDNVTVRVASKLRVREVQLGETPFELSQI